MSWAVDQRRIQVGTSILLVFLSFPHLTGCADSDNDGSAHSIALRGPRGLDVCPALLPQNPQRVPDAERLRCQKAVALAGRTYARASVEAQSACLDRVLRGEIVGDPDASCRGLRFLSTGEIRLPTDPETASALIDAVDDLQSSLTAACSEEALTHLDTCGNSIDEVAACLVADHWEHAQHVLDQTYGQVSGTVSAVVSDCQAAIASAAARLVDDQARAMALCVTDGAAASSEESDLGSMCIGTVEGGAFRQPRDFVTAQRLDDAETTLREGILAACDDGLIGELDTCGENLTSLQECLICSLRREAMLLIGAQLGGTPDHATTHFIDWRTLRNPILGLPDARLKDQALAQQDGYFYLLTSPTFETEDPKVGRTEKVHFRSRDLRHWETYPETMRPEGSGAGSIDLSLIDGEWHAVFQSAPAGNPELRRLYLSTSTDLVHWTTGIELAPTVLPGESIIDGALARVAEGHYYLVMKWRVPQVPFFTRSAQPVLNQEWLPGEPFIAQSENVLFGIGPGFAENFQLIEIDGRIRLVATARDPEGFRCPNEYTCSHEPFIYSFAVGDGSQYEDWKVWDHKTQLRVPYEGWNPVMHANTGFINDWRDDDGFFYLTYAGSSDSESFQRRGHGMIGIARSRDLIHWRVPGDLRD